MRRKPYKRLKFEDRQKVEKMVADGKSIDEIALAVGVTYQTMYRELRRGGEPYSANVAQQQV